MRYIAMIIIIINFGGCSAARVPVKAGKTAVKTAATGVKLVGKGAKAVVD